MGRKRAAPASRARGGRRRRPSGGGTMRWALAAVVAAGVIRGLLVGAYHIPSTTMEDTLLAGDYLLVDRLTYGAPVPFTSWRLPALSRPATGDVIVVRDPADAERVLVRRCVAVAGQTVEVRDKVLFVDGERAVDPRYSKYEDPRVLPGSVSPRDQRAPQRVPEGSVFVMCDNRDQGRDSRHWGPVPLSRVIGRSLLCYWSCAPARHGDGSSGLLQRVRWGRIGQWVE